MNKLNFYFAAIITIVFFSSCATMMTGTKSTIYVSSYPAGATIKVDGKKSGETPQAIELKRKTFKKAPKIEVSKNDYDTKTLPLQKKFVAWTLFAPIYGLPIDAFAGGLFKYKQEEMFVDLTNGKTSKILNPGEFFYIVNLKNDTTYCYPDVKIGGKVKYKNLNTGKEQKASAEDILSIKCIEEEKQGVSFLHFRPSKMKEVYFDRKQISLKEKKADKTNLLKLVLKNGEYSIYKTEVEFGGAVTGANAAGGGSAGSSGYAGGGTAIYYLLYRGDELISESIKNKEYKEHKKYFSRKDSSDYPKNKDEYKEVFSSLFN